MNVPSEPMTFAVLRSTTVTGATSVWFTIGALLATVVVEHAAAAGHELAADDGGVEATAHGGKVFTAEFLADFQVFDEHFSSPKVSRLKKSFGSS